jgi:hypothetical protein
VIGADVSAILLALGVPPKRCSEVLQSWRAAGSPEARAWSVLEHLGPEATDPTWPVRQSQDLLLKWGLYSPLQLLALHFSNKAKPAPGDDFPFLFGLMGRLTEALVCFRTGRGTAAVPAARVRREAHRYSALYQSVFRLREQREEREPLSLEVRLPLEADASPLLPLKRFAQVVGRGVGVATGAKLADHGDPRAQVNKLFHSHNGAPSTRLYHLDSEHEYIPSKDLSLTLRRDGLVSLASQYNPLLDFYDGGWHIVDMEGGRRAVDRLLTRRFKTARVDSDLSKFLVRLAYHMATHWHGGILAVVDEAKAEKVLHHALPESKAMTLLIRKAVGATKGQFKITDVDKPTDSDLTPLPSKGLGRLFLTLAIQDGAVLFGPDGRFLSASRFVSDVRDNIGSGGAGARAALALSHCGLAIKISADGAVRVFATEGKRNYLVPAVGLRIR